MRFFQKSILPFVILAIVSCGCGSSSDSIETEQKQKLRAAPQAPEKSGPLLKVKRNADAETILVDLGLDAWAFEVKGVPWTWEVTIFYRPQGKNRRSRKVFHQSYLESSKAFYAKNSSADANENAFGSVVLLMPDPVTPAQQFEEDLIITTKLGFDPAGDAEGGRRAVRETLRTPIKEIYPASLGSYTSKIGDARGSQSFMEIPMGQSATLVDEVFEFEHQDNRLPPDERETVTVRLIISALDPQ